MRPGVPELAAPALVRTAGCLPASYRRTPAELNASHGRTNCAIITRMATANRRHNPARVAPLTAAPPIAAGENDHAKLATALDHSWRWFELRVSHGMQMLNFGIVAFALLSAAYVSALSDKLFGIAGAIALLAAVVAITAYLTARRQRQIGWVAADPIREIQRRLAADLSIDSLRILDRSPAARSRWRSAMWLAAVLHAVVLVTCLVAAAAAWFWLSG